MTTHSQPKQFFTLTITRNNLYRSYPDGYKEKITSAIILQGAP